jgi:predicted metal-binding membrane protein
MTPSALREALRMRLSTGTSRDFWGRALLVAAVCLLSLLSWIALWRFSTAPYLHHHPGHAEGLFATAFFGFFVLGWTVMAVAMMLPSSVPLLVAFHEAAATRGDRAILVMVVIAGYLGAWVIFGSIVYVGAAGIAHVIATIRTGGINEWLTSGLILMVAGAFQFTRLKYRCLDKCRSPSSFVMEHWCGGGQRWKALRIGTLHGVFCIGCCWALMLLMFLVSLHNLAWMLMLAAVMTVEKNTRWGHHLSAPLGVVLFGTGTIMLAMGINVLSN